MSDPAPAATQSRAHAPVPPILEFEGVRVEASLPHESMLAGVSFALRPGELLLVLLDRDHLHVPLADAAAGLVIPNHGTVRFEGRPWRNRPAGEAARARGRIGRLFDEVAWVSNLTIEENLTLQQRHHTRRSVEELREEAAALAARFRLPGLPLGRVEQHREQDLLKAACVRAFLGEPVLILLERPARQIYAEVMPALVNTVQEARDRGAAVLWTTSNRRVWEDPGVRPTHRAQIAGVRWHLCESDAATFPLSTCQ
ncbi:MAG: hypothetical protein D6766_00025 [Verrucomicrobia bacterium]|nr:MAG: hypothetical protein D6766_00025 [Verrucomicrobiota bacterium]